MLNIYSNKNIKFLLIIPVIVLITALYFAAQVQDGIDLRGGMTLTVPVSGAVDVAALESAMKASFDIPDAKVRMVSGGVQYVYVEFSGERSLLSAEKALTAGDYAQAISLSKKFTGTLNVTGEDKAAAETYFTKAREAFKNQLTALLSEKLGVSTSLFSVQDIGSSLGSSFKEKALMSVLIAFVLISLLVFYYFRDIVVALSALQAVVFNVIIGYAALGFFGIPLSLVTLAPVLMLIGYSIETNIMLNDRMMKRKDGTPMERLGVAFKTGMTMILTAIFTMLSLLIVSYYANIATLFNISLILTMGLIGDLLATWITNALIILWYAEKKAGVKK